MDKTIFSAEYDLFLNHLRGARMKAELTQAQLAERLQESQSWVSRCERGERRIDIIEARAFCAALNIPFVDFIAMIDGMLREKNL